jgi:hypothetical protein
MFLAVSQRGQIIRSIVNSRLSRRRPAGIGHERNSTSVDVPPSSIVIAPAARVTLARRALAAVIRHFQMRMPAGCS